MGNFSVTFVSALMGIWLLLFAWEVTGLQTWTKAKRLPLIVLHLQVLAWNAFIWAKRGFLPHDQCWVHPWCSNTLPWCWCKCDMRILCDVAWYPANNECRWHGSFPSIGSKQVNRRAIQMLAWLPVCFVPDRRHKAAWRSWRDHALSF